MFSIEIVVYVSFVFGICVASIPSKDVEYNYFDTKTKFIWKLSIKIIAYDWEFFSKVNMLELLSMPPFWYQKSVTFFTLYWQCENYYMMRVNNTRHLQKRSPIKRWNVISFNWCKITKYSRANSIFKSNNTGNITISPNDRYHFSKTV